ncbi:MAG: hypothetical protein JWR85_4186 [Marmoricola sp.]|nr:hypothetical protein [Marmoricola sp.]
MPKPKDLVRYDATDLRVIENTGRLDANESLYFARQLEYIRPQAYQTRRAPLNAMALIPVSTDVPAGAKTVTYRMWDSVGMAKIIANYADDLPRAAVFAREYTSPIRGIGISYGYTFQDIRAAQMSGSNLDTAEQYAAKRGHDETINKLAFGGDTISGLPGFLSNVNLPVYVLPSDGTGASKTFASKTPDQILRDMNGLVNSVLTQTKGVHRVNQVWMPLTQYTYINSTIRGPNSDRTILAVWLDANPGIRVIPVLELTGAGAGGTDLMIALENDRENFHMEVPMSFLQHAPQLDNLEFTVPCESRFGGVIVNFPLAFATASGL